ncbi:putative ribonuclease H-like domain-containing protein, partial [Tanacetum coccineum]
GFKPALSFMKPFGCHVTILNTLDSLGKFDGKSDEGFFVGYSLSSKAFRVYNTRTRRVEENLHIGFLENKPMIEGNGPKWLFDIDSLTQSMNYVPLTAGTISNEFADASYFDSPSKDDDGELKSVVDDQKQDGDGPNNENVEKDKFEDDSSTKEVNAAGQHVNTASPKVNTISPLVNTTSSYDQNSPKDMFTMGASHTLEATHVEFFSDEDEPKVDLGNITNSYTIPTTPNTRIHKDHPIENVIGDVKTSVQTRRMSKPTSEQGLNQQALLKLYMIHLWWKQCRKNFWNSNFNRQEEGIDYEEVFAPVARIKAIRLFLAYASFMGFLVYQMDVKSAFLYGTIEEEVYVTQPPGFKDSPPPHWTIPDKVYKVVKAFYGLHQAPRAWYETLANYLLGNGFKIGKIDQTLFIKKQKGDILLVQVYVDDIIFSSTNKALCTGFEKLMKDKFQMISMGELTFFLGGSMIGSLMYLTASRPDIMFACKKQTVVATATTEAEYVAAASCCGQVLWIQNQLLDYRYNFMNTMIHIDNNILLYKSFDAGTGVRHVKRGWDTKIPQSSGPPVKVGDEAVHKELGDRMERATTTASSLESKRGTVLVTSIRPNPWQHLMDQVLRELVQSAMKRVSKGYSGVITPLFDTMLVQHQGEAPSIQTTPETSPSKITSSPSLSSYHTSISVPSTSQPPIIPTEEAASMPHESPL